MNENVMSLLNAEYIVHSDDGGDGWQFDVMRLFLDAMRGREEIQGGDRRGGAALRGLPSGKHHAV